MHGTWAQMENPRRKKQYTTEGKTQMLNTNQCTQKGYAFHQSSPSFVSQNGGTCVHTRFLAGFLVLDL